MGKEDSLINNIENRVYEKYLTNQTLPRRGNSSVEKMTTQNLSPFFARLWRAKKVCVCVCLVFLPS